MYGIYYKIPIPFKELVQKKEIEKTTLENSIAQYLNLILTSSFGECKFNERFGCKIWEIDFDLLADNTTLKEKIKTDVTDALWLHETRLQLKEVTVTLSETKATAYNNSYRMKKQVAIRVYGHIKKTNRPFDFYSHFFVGPLSYT